jgi:hypothetical protein
MDTLIEGGCNAKTPFQRTTVSWFGGWRRRFAKIMKVSSMRVWSAQMWALLDESSRTEV